MKCLFAALLFVVPSFVIAAPAASAPTAAQCQGEMATPLYTCIRQEAGVDIRLYVQEYQTCVNGKITEFDRSVSGLYASAGSTAADSEDVVESQVAVTYAPARTVIPDTFLTTMILPTAATLQTSAGRFEMKMTTDLAPDYEGALDEENHYVGSYTQFDKKGSQVEAGALSCFVVP